MALTDELKVALYSARSIAGQLGFRPHTVSLVTVYRQGTHTGDGARAEVLTPILEANGQSPTIVWAKDEDVAMGLVPKGQAIIGPITPSFSGGGTDLSDLAGADLERGDVRLLRITGPQHPNGADYRIRAIKADKALNYMITAIPSGTQAL